MLRRCEEALAHALEASDTERVPLYDFECERCGRRIEVLQKYDDPPPVEDTPCPSNDIIVGSDTLVEADNPLAVYGEKQQEPCQFARMPSTILQRWRGEHGNEGRGGWTRQGDVMIRASRGKSGEDRR